MIPGGKGIQAAPAFHRKDILPRGRIDQGDSELGLVQDVPVRAHETIAPTQGCGRVFEAYTPNQAVLWQARACFLHGEQDRLMDGLRAASSEGRTPLNGSCYCLGARDLWVGTAIRECERNVYPFVRNPLE